MDLRIRIEKEKEAAATSTVADAQRYLEGLWRNISLKDPIEIVLTDCGGPSVRYPVKRARKDRRVVVRAPAFFYRPGDTVEAVVKAVRLDPVAAALRGELYMQESDRDKVETTGEAVVFLVTYMMWNVLRKYKLIQGRKGKSASARYAFENLRAYRSGFRFVEKAG